MCAFPKTKTPNFSSLFSSFNKCVMRLSRDAMLCHRRYAQVDINHIIRTLTALFVRPTVFVPFIIVICVSGDWLLCGWKRRILRFHSFLFFFMVSILFFSLFFAISIHFSKNLSPQFFLSFTFTITNVCANYVSVSLHFLNQGLNFLRS